MTLDVLKNYASINSNIVINEGNVLKTVSEAKNVLSSSKIDMEFPKTIGFYDLNEFLSTLNLIDLPTIKFDDNYAMISDSTGRSRIKYHYSNPEMLTSPAKDIIMPDAEVTFVLDQDTLQRLKRASSVLGHSEFSVTTKDNVIVLNVIDNTDKTSNAFSIDVDGTFVQPNFNFVFNIANLKLIDADYNVAISSKLISHFTLLNKTNEFDIQYWVALEKTSTYGE